MGDMKRGLMQITIGREFSTRHMAEVSRSTAFPSPGRLSLLPLRPGGIASSSTSPPSNESGALVIPQVSCRPLNFEFTFAEPFIFDVMKFMNELRSRCKAPGTPAAPMPIRRGEKLRSE
jgi:hypothetical protein